jgi:hypothetical protein
VFNGEGSMERKQDLTATAKKAPVMLLLQFPASACSTEAERSGAFRVQYLAGEAGNVKQG